MHCLCGSTVCECEILCRCCPMKCKCRCLRCFELRKQRGVYCDHCGGFVNAALYEPIHEWTRTGVYPNLDFISSNYPQPSCSGSDKGADMKRSVSKASPNPGKKSQRSEPLIFQMDDIDDSPGISTSTFSQPLISFTGHPQVSPNITVTGNHIRNRSHFSSQMSSDTNVQRPTESYGTEIHSPCNPNALVSERTELHVREMQNPQDRPGSSQMINTAKSSRHRLSYLNEITSLCHPTELVSERTELHVSEKPILQDLPGCSRNNPNECGSKPEDSQLIDCAWRKIPAPSNEYASERTESYVSELIFPQNISGFSRYNPNQSASKSEEPQIIAGASCMVSSFSNEYSSDSLPSLPWTSSSDDSIRFGQVSVDSRSTTRQVSTSAPSVYNIPESSSESESLKQETFVDQSTSETTPTSDLSHLETLRMSDSTDRLRTRSESSSSIETLPSNLPNGTGNINGHPDLPSFCETSASLNKKLVHNTLLQDESMKTSTSQTSAAANWLKLSSPEMSKTTRYRQSSESSIETLSRDSVNETSEDEHTTNISPKDDD